MKNTNEEKIPLETPFDDKVLELQAKFDNALDEQNIDELKLTIDEALQVLATMSLNSISNASLFYSIATTYSDLEMYSEDYQNEDTQEKILFYFRKSLDAIHEFGKLDNANPYYLGLQLELYTNYANSLNRLGRTVEAIRYYHKALDINPSFGMAVGNCGIAYITYANIVYDPSHRDILHHFAYNQLRFTLSEKEQLHSQAIEYFTYYVSIYDKDYKKEVLEKELNFDMYSLGDTENEIEYRTWVLHKHLYLNPLNDLQITDSFIATDILHLPNMRMKVSDGLNYKYHDMFNVLKQEYISARFNFFECTQLTTEVHFADKETHLINTLDYTSFSLRLEKLKLSYRSLYSLFDKVAYFLNDYFDLGIKERDINFRSIWKSEKKGKYGYTYRNTLPYLKNHSLKAIYWLFKDLFVKLYSSPSPHAKELNMLRNALEHKYVKVYSSIFYEKENRTNQSNSFEITEEALEEYTLQLLEMVRELLIYLSLSIHINEQQSILDKEEFCPPINLYELDDEWKY